MQRMQYAGDIADSQLLNFPLNLSNASSLLQETLNPSTPAVEKCSSCGAVSFSSSASEMRRDQIVKRPS
jgi:hypothetical protein